jgi:predicted RNA-binding Zn-ribbon protein involved in translation (DUF1610 family)
MRVTNIKASRKKEHKKTVLRCPQCGSTDLYYELGLITGYKYHCKNCQYVGPLVIQDEVSKDDAGRDDDGDEPLQPPNGADKHSGNGKGSEGRPGDAVPESK